jgi:hypothetical protein
MLLKSFVELKTGLAHADVMNITNLIRNDLKCKSYIFQGLKRDAWRSEVLRTRRPAIDEFLSTWESKSWALPA